MMSEQELHAGSGTQAQRDALAQEDTGAQEDTDSRADTGAQADTGSRADTGARGDTCQACGAARPAADRDSPATVLRATIPQPIAAALRSTQRLSARERTVFQFLGAGYDNRSIARELGVSERTVKRHVTVILAKLGLESRLQAGLTALIISSSFPGGPDGAH
jgi:DNA-binding NarL/FixJ family response regulator